MLGYLLVVHHLMLCFTRIMDKNIGRSVLEEEDQRGVAHTIGACQNAVTSADETVYEFFVPVNKPELLSQIISVKAEFSSEVQASAEDLERERGVVMEEFRTNRNANGWIGIKQTELNTYVRLT